MAPEIVAGRQYLGPQVDVWSFGVVLVAMLQGTTPFAGAADREIRRKILRAQYSIPEGSSDSVRDLTRGILTVDPDRRLSLPEVRAHPWFTSALPS
jgi:serine/threonine protein kinase